MLKFLPYVVQALFIIGGLSLGILFKSGAFGGSASGEQPAAHDGEKLASHDDGKHDSSHGDKEKDHGGAKRGSSGGHGGGGSESAAYGYLKFSRQFVVPVVDPTGVGALVVMDINIEVPPDVTESVYLQEPKLRDAMLNTLLSLSNKGAFNGRLLEPANIDMIRARLLEAAQSVIGEDAQGVLILSIARQDV